MAQKGGKRRQAPAYSADAMAVRYMAGLALIAMGVLIFMAVELGLHGNIFEGLRRLCFGMCGIMAFVLPALPLWAGVLVVWSIIDRFRYSRYQRRYRVASPVMPVVPYYPIFWGRPRTVVAPAAPRPPRPVSTSNHSRPSGTYHSTSSRPSSSSRPSGGSRPSSGYSRPGGFGKSGFGGGRR